MLNNQRKRNGKKTPNKKMLVPS